MYEFKTVRLRDKKPYLYITMHTVIVIFLLIFYLIRSQIE